MSETPIRASPPGDHVEEAGLMPDGPTSEGGPAPQRSTVAERLWWVLNPTRTPPPINPALLRQAEERAENAQNRVADRITAFSGSMLFVYVHLLWFGCWIGFGVEKYPYGLLTMIVSLEAIFLSTFVLISQNRADAKRQVIANQEWRTVQKEDRQNRELLELSKQILAAINEVRSNGDTAKEENEQNRELLELSRQTLSLTKEVHAVTGVSPTDSGASPRGK